jgi:hypothetical protein
MARVQVAHGRHETDRLALAAPAADRGTQGGSILYGLHGAGIRRLS